MSQGFGAGTITGLLALGKEENHSWVSSGKLGELFIFQGCGTEKKSPDPAELFTLGST